MASQSTSAVVDAAPQRPVADGFYSAEWAGPADGPSGAGVTAGFEVVAGRVTEETAPILKWARGKPAPTLTRWVEGKGGQVRLVAQFETLF